MNQHNNLDRTKQRITSLIWYSQIRRTPSGNTTVTQFKSSVVSVPDQETKVCSEPDTYFHVVTGVSEVGEGAEGRQHSLCNSHQALWYDSGLTVVATKATFLLFFFSVSVSFSFLSFFFFSFFTLAPNAQKKRESNLSSSQKQVPKVCLPLLIPPLLSLPPLSCLSLSAAESSFKSLFFMYVSTVRRWSVSVSFLAGSVSSPPEDCSFTVT